MKSVFLIPTLLKFMMPFSCIGQCPNKCSKHGLCNTFGVCECAEKYTGADCSQRVCPFGTAFSDIATADNIAHHTMVCSGRGSCVSGNCICDEGFTGVACERTKCQNHCNFRGKCMSIRSLAQTTRNQYSQKYNYDQVWDRDKIFGCVCDTGWTGYDCSVRVCPKGDDPLTTTGTLQEVQLLRCYASGSTGHLLLFFDGKASTNIPANASIMSLKKAIESIPSIDSVSITYSHGNTLCRNDLSNIVSITFLSNFGPLTPLVPETFDMESWSSIEVASDNLYGTLVDHNGVAYTAVKGDKENDECSNRGVCDQDTGTCKCFNTNGDQYAGSNGYGGIGNRGDCGHALTVITSCPGDPPCSNHGVCNPVTKRCSCEQGFMGGDCSLRTCKKGLSWFSYPSSSNVAHDIEVECSNMGICQRAAGECSCNNGFFGAACEYMECAGGNEPMKSCSGHGTCLTMRELGRHNVASNGSYLPVIYGTDPNDAKTWDADRIMGCLCDEGFEGYSCSERTCPYGVDPVTGLPQSYECSNHGLCDHETGKCNCFLGFGSSDGNGNSGLIPDCGRRLTLRGH